MFPSEIGVTRTQGMGVAFSGVVDGPRAVDILHLLLSGVICNPCLLGHLHHHRYAQFPRSIYLSTPRSTARPDSKGRLLDSATFDFADESAATEMHDIPITLINLALYDRG